MMELIEALEPEGECFWGFRGFAYFSPDKLGL
jgi:hypothetical protein